MVGKFRPGQVGKFSSCLGKKYFLLVHCRNFSLLCFSFLWVLWLVDTSIIQRAKVVQGHTASLLTRLLCLSCLVGLLTLMTQGWFKMSNVVHSQIGRLFIFFWGFRAFTSYVFFFVCQIDDSEATSGTRPHLRYLGSILELCIFHVFFVFWLIDIKESKLCRRPNILKTNKTIRNTKELYNG